MTPAAKWVFDEGPQYKKHKRKYMHNQTVNKALCERLESLQVARDPGRLGDIKLGPLNGVYGTRLSRSVRLLYLVDHAAQVIRLLAIGDHKEVYGRD